MTWVYNNEIVENPPEDAVGFVYMIENLRIIRCMGEGFSNFRTEIHIMDSFKKANNTDMESSNG